MEQLKSKVVRRGRNRQAANEAWEIRYTANKLLVSENQVREAMKAVGKNGNKIEAYLKATKMKSLNQPQ